MVGLPTLALISGSLRAASTNSAVVRTVADLAEGLAEPVTYDGMGSLPHFNPDDDIDPLPAEVARLRALIASADAILICTPEYAGDLPGSFKNLLDWTVGGTEISDKPVGWVNASVNPTGAAGAHAALRTVLGYTGAYVVDAAAVRVPVPRGAVGPAGLITDPALRRALTGVLTTLLSADPAPLSA
ncbi:NADPH-dependent FMN reductase [Streptomyces sp. NPDC001205]